MAVKVLRQQEGHAQIECSFCQGKGVDPFELMSSLSACPVCRGRGRLHIREPLQECAFCGGTGAHPYTRMTCSACLGKGAVTMRGPVKKCAACGGTGADGHARMPCAACKGIGVVRAQSSKRSKKNSKRKTASTTGG